ncbi:MAG: sugar O-acetyltransferase [Nitrospira sp.]|nr:MAG: sugar O-acetyltransferase [Nitrospira sp.]
MINKSRRVVIVGAGGQARVLLSLLRRLGDHEVVGILDRDEAHLGEVIEGVSIIGVFSDLESLEKRRIHYVALALGDNHERFELGCQIITHRLTALTLIHPTALIEPDVRIGAGSVVCAGAILSTGVTVDEGVIINTGAIIDHETRIARYAHIGPGSCVAGRVKVGERTFVGVGSRIIDNIEIGSDSIIGAGSVVIETIPSNVVAYGVPAKIHRHV